MTHPSYSRRFKEISSLFDLTEGESEVTATTSFANKGRISLMDKIQQQFAPKETPTFAEQLQQQYQTRQKDPFPDDLSTEAEPGEYWGGRIFEKDAPPLVLNTTDSTDSCTTESTMQNNLSYELPSPARSSPETPERMPTAVVTPPPPPIPTVRESSIPKSWKAKQFRRTFRHRESLQRAAQAAALLDEDDETDSSSQDADSLEDSPCLSEASVQDSPVRTEDSLQNSTMSLIRSEDSVQNSTISRSSRNGWQEMKDTVDRYYKRVQEKHDKRHETSSLETWKATLQDFCKDQNQLGKAMAVSMYKGMELMASFPRKPRNEALRQRWRNRMQQNQTTEVASTVVSNMSCRELSVEKYRAKILQQMNKKEPQHKEIQRLLDELEQSERRQKLLEKQLLQAGVVLAEDIPYQLAKDKVASISKRMNEIGASDVVHEDPVIQKQLREEYFLLEKDMQKYLSALMLTDEYAQERKQEEEAWESRIFLSNQRSLQALRRHMPVEIRKLTPAQLENECGLQKSLIQRFRRKNVLQLVRVDPKVVARWHPSSLESLRVTGLTLTERKALHSYTLDLAAIWNEGGSKDPMTTRKLQWYNTLRTNFKEALAKYEQHLEDRPNANACLVHKCGKIGNQCPVRANQTMDYLGGDLGFPVEGYEAPTTIVVQPKRSASEIIAQAKNQPESIVVGVKVQPKTPKPAVRKAAPSGLLAAIASRKID